MKPLSSSSDNIQKIFADSYLIPDYQREYTWDKEKCEQLWQDIYSFYNETEDTEDSYFLGCITLYKEIGSNSWKVTDGQQRLITLSLLMKALYDKDINNEGLLECLFEKNIVTGEILVESPKIVSEVLDDNNQDFKDIICNKKEEVDKKSKFYKNYKTFVKLIEENIIEHYFDSFVKALLTRIEILRIKSDDIDDALQIFETINDRGTPLNETDIFKVKLCRQVDEKNRKQDVIEPWKNLEDHWFLFTTYMYILRAKDDSKDSSIPKLKKYFNQRDKLFKDWGKILHDISKIHDINTGNWNMPSKTRQWWKVLEVYPNEFWKYPLYVFLFEKMTKMDDYDKWDTADIEEEFNYLIRETLKYVIIKGLNHRNVNRIKSPILNVCADIAKGRTNWSEKYENDIKSHKDREEFDKSIEDHNAFSRYSKVMVYLGACLYSNEKGDSESFCENLEGNKIDIEHILPKSWNHYDGWDTETHADNLNRLGNLLLIDKKVNIKASNEFFTRKKEKYVNSSFLEAQELGKSDMINWDQPALSARDKQIKQMIFNFLGI